jgi:hypothetical protein
VVFTQVAVEVLLGTESLLTILVALQVQVAAVQVVKAEQEALKQLMELQTQVAVLVETTLVAKQAALVSL